LLSQLLTVINIMQGTVQIIEKVRLLYRCHAAVRLNQPRLTIPHGS